LYYEYTGPANKDWQGDKEETVFMLLGSCADLRKTADQQYINLSVSYYKILVYDHRNTGRSTIKDEPCTMEDYADDAAALLEAVLPEKLPVYVIGISFGGMVAQHLAIRHPHLIKKLVLCCCATGGGGGMSFPIHQWYAPGVPQEERVMKRMMQANSDRNDEWMKKSKSEFEMSFAILKRDEKCGESDPLRWEGVTRQLDARKEHDTWDKISQLEMDVLVLGSPKDMITPPKLSENMAKRIGKNAEMKLDFDWGHPFMAADVAAPPFVNEWLRSPLKNPTAPPPGPAQIWEVVGGKEKGGIVVRAGVETSSAELERLSTGALIEQIKLVDGRLNFKRLTGTGPGSGWISVKLKEKDLAVRTDKTP